MTLSSISLDVFTNIANSVFTNDEVRTELFSSALTLLYYKNEDRELRTDKLIDVDYFNRVSTSFFNINKKKLEIILDTANQDFISNDNIVETTGTGIGYNIDYFGGEGQREKDTSDTKTKSSAINNKDKLKNYQDLSHNLIFRQYINLICTTYIEGDNWDEY